MKIFVKTLKGTNFEIEVKPEQTVENVKKIIENSQGADVYPAAQQMLIHQGKVLKDGTTLDENKVAEKCFVVIMLTKNKGSSGEGSMTSSAPTVKAPHADAPPPISAPLSTTPQPPVAALDVYGEAASNILTGKNLDGAIQQILDMGGGTWDRDTVVRAFSAAYNNPERAVEYLYSGIPESTEAPAAPGRGLWGPAVNVPTQPQEATQSLPDPASVPNANPLNLFPQSLPGMGQNAGDENTVEFIRNTPQFHALREMVQANPQVLQSMLQELERLNPQLVRLIQENQADFLRLINEPVEGEEGNIPGQLAGAMPQAITVTPEEQEAIERLEGMGFNRAIVTQAFFACDKNEELAANYLLDHMHDLEE